MLLAASSAAGDEAGWTQPEVCAMETILLEIESKGCGELDADEGGGDGRWLLLL